MRKKEAVLMVGEGEYEARADVATMGGLIGVHEEVLNLQHLDTTGYKLQYPNKYADSLKKENGVLGGHCEAARGKRIEVGPAHTWAFLGFLKAYMGDR